LSPAARGVVTALALASLLTGCGDSGGRDPLAERGRQTFLAQCTACHNPEPSQPGPIGPPVKGASRELLEAKVLHGSYPPGYTPKRTTTIMVPLPAVAPDIPALAAYLR